MPKLDAALIAPRKGASRRLDLPMVVNVAAAMVDRDGTDALTLSALAVEIGVKPPSLYAHLQGLDELRGHVAHFGAQELERIMLAAGYAKSGDEAARAIIKAFYTFGLTRPGLYAAINNWTGSSNREALEVSRRITENIFIALRPLFDGLDREKQIHRLRIVRSALHGFILLNASRSFQDPSPLGATFDHMTDELIAMARRR